MGSSNIWQAPCGLCAALARIQPKQPIPHSQLPKSHTGQHKTLRIMHGGSFVKSTIHLFCCWFWFGGAFLLFFFLGIGFDFFFNTYLVGHEQDGNKYTKIF